MAFTISTLELPWELPSRQVLGSLFRNLMILLETPIVENPSFRQFIKLYKRFIDGIFLI